jgi:hypothetical protein
MTMQPNQTEGFRLISFVCETDADLLPHFVHWYRRLGVDRFHFVMHGTWSRESLTMLAGLPGVERTRWVNKPFCKSLKCDEITAIARRHVGEWVVFADAEELLEMPTCAPTFGPAFSSSDDSAPVISRSGSTRRPQVCPSESATLSR